MNGAEDAEIGSGTSSTTRSAKNLSVSVELAKNAEVGWGDGGDDETVKKLPLSKKPNVPIEYPSSLYSEKIWVYLNSFWPFLKLSVKGIIRKAIKQNSC